MRRWFDQLAARLHQRRAAGLYRSLRPTDRSDRLVRRDGRTLINFAGNDYLALASHPALAEAVSRAARHLGTGSGASRLVTGHLELHAAVEQRFARFKHAEAALICPTGYMANLAVLTTLARPDDLICIDKLNHASLIDAARMSGAAVRVYPHGNMQKLARLLERSAAEKPDARRLIVSDSVFSMDGDMADLATLCELRQQFDAILIIDEAHGTGVLGPSGAGLAEQLSLTDQIDVTISTASKALGGLGGIITASSLVIESIVNNARSFIYTTGVPPTQAAAIDAALQVIVDEPQRREQLLDNARHMRQLLAERGWPIPSDPTPIIPVIIGSADAALALAERVEAAGFLAPAIRPPTVAPETSRLRISLRCDHTEEDLRGLTEAIGTPGT
jgi:8-amino-7-oxononanoate synthase